MVLKKQTSNKLRITVEIPFGPFKSSNDIAFTKRKVKAKVSKIAFSPVVKTSKGYVTRGKLSYIKTVAASASDVKAALQSRLPGAKISVSRV